VKNTSCINVKNRLLESLYSSVSCTGNRFAFNRICFFPFLEPWSVTGAVCLHCVASKRQVKFRYEVIKNHVTVYPPTSNKSYVMRLWYTIQRFSAYGTLKYFYCYCGMTNFRSSPHILILIRLRPSSVLEIRRYSRMPLCYIAVNDLGTDVLVCYLWILFIIITITTV